MKLKIFLFLFFSAFFIIDDSSAKVRISGSRAGSSWGRSRVSSSKPSSHGTSYGTSHGTSYGTSHGTSYGTSHGTSYGTSHGTSYGKSQGTSAGGVSSSIGHSSGKVMTPQNKDINTHFLNAEGGGATRPVQTKPSQPIHGNLFPPKLGVTTEKKQTSSVQPSAPPDHIMKSTGTLQSQGHPVGQQNPSWSNPHLNDNRPTLSSPAHISSNIPNSGVNRPYVPGSSPPPIGFKDHVYPQNHPSGPTIPGHPPYPLHPSSNSWSAPSLSPPIHQSNSMPLGNPYSMHPPGHTYNPSGHVYNPSGHAYNPPGYTYNAAGQTYYPQQPHVFSQPAMQPFVPGQTIVMMPGQQDSGRGFGQMVKEALVFSTINAGVNRLINPHSHTHYIESKPENAPATTTHITYNNQYFNAAPEINDTTNSTNIPHGTIPTNNSSGTFTSNAGASNVPTLGTGNTYIPNISSSGVPNSNGMINDGISSSVGTIDELGKAKILVNENAITSGTNTSNDQNNSFVNSTTLTNTFSYRISDNELFKITEELFVKQSIDVSNYIKLNLQKRVISSNVTDEAEEPLFRIEPELFFHPTIDVVRSLYGSYEHDFRKKLNRTLDTRKQENLLIDTFLNTDVMTKAMEWLADYGFIDPDDFERKDVLRRIWFTMFSGSTCGFERVFESENYGTSIIGVQDWLYFQHQEFLKRVDYMGYVDKLDLGSTASLLKLNFQMDGIVRPNATIFVGTLPELEMSLYTICFYARSNNLCPVSLGGTKFNIYTHSFMYFGNEVIDLGLPMF